MKQINLFLADRSLTKDFMLQRNGDYTIKHPVSAKAEMNKNGAWYCTIELTKDSVGYNDIPKESIFKIFTNIGTEQLYMVIYVKEDKVKQTYTCYASQVFWNAQKEAIVFDLRVVGGNWEDALSKANEIITSSDTVYPYKLYGKSNPSVNEKVTDIEYGKVYEILLASDESKTIAAKGNKASSNNTRIICKNNAHEKSQRYYFMKEGEYVVIYNCSSDFTLINYSSSGVVLYQNKTEKKENTELWIVDNENGLFSFRHKLYPTKYLSIGTTENANATLSTTKTQFVLRNADWVQTAYWERKNVIECLFGSEDNSMLNRWAECEQYNYIAMPDNFDMYFGDNEFYPEYLKPKTLAFNTMKLITEYTKTVSMEDVVTGLIPKGYNGKILKETVNGEEKEVILKSDMYDEYMIHRNAFVEYGDIRLLESKTSSSSSDSDDDSDDDAHSYATEKGFYRALRYAGERDLNSDKYRLPSIKYTLKIADLHGYDVGNELASSSIKINDVLMFIDRDTRSTIKFTLSKLVYDLISERNESFTLEGNN